MTRIVVATLKPWNVRCYQQWSARTPHTTQLVCAPTDLTDERLAAFAPDYIFIRMLDAESYPPAFIRHGGRRYEFSHAAMRDGDVIAQVKIVPGDERSPCTS